MRLATSSASRQYSVMDALVANPIDLMLLSGLSGLKVYRQVYESTMTINNTGTSFTITLQKNPVLLYANSALPYNANILQLVPQKVITIGTSSPAILHATWNGHNSIFMSVAKDSGGTTTVSFFFQYYIFSAE